MKSYDPNLVRSFKGKQTVRLTVQKFEFKKVIEVDMVNNQQGLGAIAYAVEHAHEHLELNADNNFFIVLTEDAGNTMLCVDDEQEQDFLSRMVVAAEIVDLVKVPFQGEDDVDAA